MVYYTARSGPVKRAVRTAPAWRIPGRHIPVWNLTVWPSTVWPRRRCWSGSARSGHRARTAAAAADHLQAPACAARRRTRGVPRAGAVAPYSCAPSRSSELIAGSSRIASVGAHSLGALERQLESQGGGCDHGKRGPDDHAQTTGTASTRARSAEATAREADRPLGRWCSCASSPIRPRRCSAALTDPEELREWAPFDAPRSLAMSARSRWIRPSDDVHRARCSSALGHRTKTAASGARSQPTGTRLTLSHTVADRSWRRRPRPVAAASKWQVGSPARRWPIVARAKHVEPLNAACGGDAFGVDVAGDGGRRGSRWTAGLDKFPNGNMIAFMARAATTTDSFNAIAEPRRRDILTLLAATERPVGEIAVDAGPGPAVGVEAPARAARRRAGRGASRRPAGLLSHQCRGPPSGARLGGHLRTVLASPARPRQGTRRA